MPIRIARGLLVVVVLHFAVPATGSQREQTPAAERQPPRIVVVTPGAPPPSASSRTVPIISLSVKDADLVEVVRSLARIAGVNLIIDPGTTGKVTAELVDVRWDHALAVILKTQGLGMELDGRILTVAEPRRLVGAP
jgi:type II secretory pathway component HofQ